MINFTIFNLVANNFCLFQLIFFSLGPEKVHILWSQEFEDCEAYAFWVKGTGSWSLEGGHHWGFPNKGIDEQRQRARKAGNYEHLILFIRIPASDCI